MKKKPLISVIIPFYNAKKYLEESINSVKNQNFKYPIEIVLIDDGSSDGSSDIVKKINYTNFTLIINKRNLGPANARNLGIKKSKGEYLFFLDADDKITKNTLNILYKEIKYSKFDYVFCDTQWIENSINQRKNKFSYSKNKIFKRRELTSEMINRIYNPNHMGGPLSAKCRLLKRNLLIKKKILFEEKLRYLEDEIFMWDFLSVVKKAKYIKKQLYIYHVHPNVETGVIRGLNLGFPISKFKIIAKHIYDSLRKRGCKKLEAKKHSIQSFIYFVINVLLSYSKSIIHKKVKFKTGIELRKKIIEEIIKNKEIEKGIHEYTASKKESVKIINAIKLKSKKLLEIACHDRAKEILKLRRKN